MNMASAKSAAHNFKESVEQATAVLILYPTDPVWGIGCDATDAAAVERIFKLKNRPDTKSMICLVHNMAMLRRLVGTIPPEAQTILENPVKPTTIVYPRAEGVAPNLVANDGSLAIRLVSDDFCEAVITALDQPLVSTSANISGRPTPTCFDEVDSLILKGVDYVVPLQGSDFKGRPSAILKLEPDQSITVIRS